MFIHTWREERENEKERERERERDKTTVFMILGGSKVRLKGQSKNIQLV